MYVFIKWKLNTATNWVSPTQWHQKNIPLLFVAEEIQRAMDLVKPAFIHAPPALLTAMGDIRQMSPHIKVNKYSLLMHRIKIKIPANFLWNEQHVFVCWFITFQSVLLWWFYSDKDIGWKIPDIGGTTIQDVGCLAAMGLAMEPGVHIMSDKVF